MGMMFIQIFYWSTNQVIVQRAMGARSLAEGQKGVLFASALKLVGPVMLCLPGIIATGIYIFITSWNEYLYALTLGGRNVRTITVAVQTLIGEYEVQWGLLTAGGIVGALPATVLFLLVQKRLISGLTQGAVKG